MIEKVNFNWLEGKTQEVIDICNEMKKGLSHDKFLDTVILNKLASRCDIIFK